MKCDFNEVVVDDDDDDDIIVDSNDCDYIIDVDDIVIYVIL